MSKHTCPHCGGDDRIDGPISPYIDGENIVLPVLPGDKLEYKVPLKCKKCGATYKRLYSLEYIGIEE